MITIADYDIKEQIYRSANSLVFRGRRERDHLPVVVKVQASEYPSPEAVAKFRREYQIGTGFDFDGIIRYYSMERYGKDSALVVEDFGAVALVELIPARGMLLPAFLHCAIQIALSLAEVHRHQIIHKDIKPRNIVTNPETLLTKLIDFGIASQLSRESQAARNPQILEGTLAYISPEQTGRMNRAVDYRTDFYSLGVTFYQMLTGHLPFDSTDPMELVHCHIARTPIPPYQVNPEIPLVVSDIVMRLLEKTAEERYQSAYGLSADLQKCLDQLESTGEIAPFTLGDEDISDRFEIPQKLYGREEEIAALMAAFNRVSEGAKEIMFVAGYSGIGKSVLVNEIHKPIVRQRGYFISGKFDQFQRNIPYASLIQAFANLVRQLLTESAERVAIWKERLLRSVGPNGQVIVDVIPEVELIIGKQPPVPELAPAETQNRFNLVFQNFVSTFAKKEHPLVIFLDDLQWADPPSLQMVKRLMTDSDTQYLFLIGAYRDNEVSDAHPLMVSIEELERSGIEVDQLTLQPLSKSSLCQLMIDTLNRELDHVVQLAEIVIQKTNGNPFFVIQFLRTIHEEGWLVFDTDQRIWCWEIEQIQELEITDNVVDLMTGKIQKLKAETQQVLKLAACIGNQFDLHPLRIVHESTPSETAEDLWEAITEGLVVPMSDAYKFLQGSTDQNLKMDVSYRFLHDRVQQAAYSLISEEDRKEVHLKIGWLLLQNTPEDELEGAIFEIVEQLNRGIDVIAERAQKDRLIVLNQMAGRQAKESNAYEAALRHYTIAINLLPQGAWQSSYELALNLHRAQAECEFLCGYYDRSNQSFEYLVNHAKSTLDKANIYSMRIYQCHQLGRWDDGIRIGREVLRLFGIDLSIEALPDEIMAEVAEVSRNMQGQEIRDLIHAPKLEDPEIRALLENLLELAIVGYGGNGNLFVWTVLKAVNLSLKHGHDPLSAYVYALYGVPLGSGMGDYKSAYEFATLGMQLAEIFQATRLKCRVEYLYSVCNYWCNHFKTSIPHKRSAYRIGLETGDFAWASWAYNNLVMTRFAMGDELESVAQDSLKSHSFAEKTQNLYSIDTGITYRQIIRSLQGVTVDRYSLSDSNFSETEHLERCIENNSGVGIFSYYLAKMRLAFLFGDYKEAYRMGLEAEKTASFALGFVPSGEHVFLYALTIANYYSSVDTDTQQGLREVFREKKEQMGIWAENCPDSYQHKFLLLEAEEARLDARHEHAMRFYRDAIESAQNHGFTQNEAMANELAAQFYTKWGFKEIARGYLVNARYGYQRWGATEKVKDMDQRNPWLRSQAAAGTSVEGRDATRNLTTDTSTAKQGSSVLDLSAVVKASQTIASEIVLETLLESLMEIVIENAGADRGLLILEKEGELVIEAEGAVAKEDIHVLQSIPVESSQALSPAIINYVARTHDSVVLNDAVHEGMFLKDPYVTQNQPKSILCMPLLNHGLLKGILYLENNLAEGAFTPDRLEVLSVLSSQAAISIENALLVDNLEQLVDQRTRELREAVIVIEEARKAAEKELDDAREMQQSLLPEHAPAIVGAEIAGRCVTANLVGGDFFNYLPGPRAHMVGLVIADVSGKAMRGAMNAVLTNGALLMGVENTDIAPGRLMSSVNNVLVGSLGKDMNVTMVIALLDTQAMTLTMANAAHHAHPQLLRNGEVTEIRARGLPLGVRPSISYQETTCNLHSGDVLVLMTDGIIEARDHQGRQYGESGRLQQLLAEYTKDMPLEAIVDAIINDATEHSYGEREDDMTVVVIRL